MTVTRRFFLTTAAAAATAAGLSSRLWASASLKLGGVRIDTLSDGHLTLPGGFLFADMPENELAPILAAHGVSSKTATPDCNVTILRDGERTVLFDVGSGSGFQPTAGELGSALDTLGVAPEDVTHVVFTHGHPDHLWGVLDDFDDPVFTNAQHIMGRVDFDYWRDKNTVHTIGRARQSFAAGAKRRLDAMAEQFAFFEDGTEVLPGVSAVQTPGHTPGHMAFEIRSGHESVMILGDCIGNDHVAFERPAWHYGSDQDAALAAATRLRLLDRLAAEKMRVIGYHIPFPGIGYAEETGGGSYRFVPESG